MHISPFSLLYAVGGYDGDRRLDSVERYDPEIDQWTCVASLNTARSGPGKFLYIRLVKY
ncbi:unnamed protein product [Protopolystoma xenopodis]|uniref:Uncharacterized protein n=1 Tax=Protopolystoma xenopodis TaxID=117903 RepID=A0A3S5A7C4_9PLAT|nr:unnamed protein product [Protopolystoma xenopodis]